MGRILQSTFERAFRAVARLAIALAVALGVFTLIEFNSGRGFLPQQRRDVWLEAQRQGEDGWQFIQLPAKEDSDLLPVPESPATYRFLLQEDSMGRTNGYWSSWRASNWVLFQVADAQHGWSLWHERSDLQGQPLERALISYVEGTIIPMSPLHAIWPDKPMHPVQMDGPLLHWRAGQYRTHVFTIAAACLLFLVVGIGVSFLVLPPRPIRPQDSRHGLQAG